MQKFGFVFPGQGSQKSGLLAELASSSQVIEQTFAEASAALDVDLWEITQHDQNKCLDRTEITQPVLLAASVAIWRLWNTQQAPQPCVLAGHSLGEYSALVCAGVITFEDAIQLVHQRGKFMQSAISAGSGKMAAIVGLDKDQIQALCEQATQGQVVSAANFNSPGQTVIAGNLEAVERAMVLCRQAGARRVLPLNVSVPSHCELMRPAAELLAAELDKVQFCDASIAVVQNVNAKINDDPELIKENLVKQLYVPVLWVDSVQLMHKTGIDKLVECGPGKVLGGLIKRIQPELTCFASDNSQSLASAIAEVST